MKDKTLVEKEIFRSLYPVSHLQTLNLLILAPLQIIIAIIYQNVVEFIITGVYNNVLKQCLLLIFVYITKYVISYLFNINIEKKTSLLSHQCKMKLYKKIVSTKLSELNSVKSREILENLSNDFSEVSNRIIKYKPEVIIGIISIFLYTMFMASKSILVTVVILLISSFQVIPPIVVKNIMQKNYQASRGIEAELTEAMVNGYNAFETIKVYNLQDYYMKLIKNIHM